MVPELGTAPQREGVDIVALGAGMPAAGIVSSVKGGMMPAGLAARAHVTVVKADCSSRWIMYTCTRILVRSEIT